MTPKPDVSEKRKAQIYQAALVCFSRKGYHQTTMDDIVAESGTSLAFPSSTTYMAREEGTDPEKTRRAENTVRGWVENEELYFPGFPEEPIEAVRGSIDYPPEGTPCGVLK